jgi:uncharacterized protein YbaP (TraB family)
MKKSILLLLLSIACFSATQAQLLWKVSGNGLKHPSYLFGTHHLIPIQFLDSVPGLYKAFNDCDAVVGEIALNSIDATSRLEMAASMPNHTKMTDLLKGDKYSTVDNELKAVMKLGLKDLSMMNPTLILSMYEMELYKKTAGITDDTQSDSYFQLVAAEKNMKVVGLETVEQQINILFGNGSLERQADILYETVLHKDSALTDIKQLDKLYKTGKLNELVKMSKRKEKKADLTDLEYAKLVDDRNTEWMKKLPKLFSDSRCFVAVGALHLGGDKGLIKQLEKAGYRVKPVE